VSDVVVVTGLGTLGAWGLGGTALAELLASGAAPRRSPIDRSAGYHRENGSRHALLLGNADLSALVPPAAARRMGAPSKLGVAAARLALRDAGIAEGDPAFADTAVVLATAFGPALFTERLLLAILKEGPENASPALFTESVASAAASQVALNLKALGPNVTVTEREAGAVQTVEDGAKLLRRGHARRALVGVVEEMTPLLHAILERFRTLAPPDAAGEEIARPFDRDRRGVLAADGATVLVLERAAEAAARGARVLCRVAAAGSGFDPTAADNGYGSDPEGVADTIRKNLRRQGVELAAIDRVVSGAAGGRPSDRAEGLVLRALWGGASAGSTLPPVLAPKATTGEWGGGHLAAAVLAAGGAEFGPTRGFRTVDPELGIVPHDGRPLAAPSLTLVLSLAAGGSLSWLVLGTAPS
jgi:3-oxoacyl-[acyl-carrier-protein] synthase II